MHDRLFLGLNGTVLALRASDGRELWRHKLASGSWGNAYTSVTLLDGQLYATHCGDLHALDPETGALRWKNPLPGLGTGFLSLAGASPSAADADVSAQMAAQAAATAAVLAATSASSSS